MLARSKIVVVTSLSRAMRVVHTLASRVDSCAQNCKADESLHLPAHADETRWRSASVLSVRTLFRQLGTRECVTYPESTATLIEKRPAGARHSHMGCAAKKRG